MRKFLLLLSSLVFSTSLIAATPTDESIDALFAATRIERTLDSMFIQMEQMTRQSMAAVTKGRTLPAEQQRIMDAKARKFMQSLREEMSWEKMRPMYLQVYRETFTQEEIDGLVAFYKSPAGLAFIEKMPLVMQKSMTLIQSHMAPFMERMRATIDEARKGAQVDR